MREKLRATAQERESETERESERERERKRDRESKCVWKRGSLIPLRQRKTEANNLKCTLCSHARAHARERESERARETERRK